MAEKLFIVFSPEGPTAPVTLHHVTGYARKPGRFSRSHRLVVPLLARYHLIQHGPHESVERLGHRGFFKRFGVDLLKEARRLEYESIELGILPEGSR